MLDTAYSCPYSIDCMHWSLKQSQILFHNCSFSKSVCFLSILFLVTVCFLPSLANNIRHQSATEHARQRLVTSTNIAQCNHLALHLGGHRVAHFWMGPPATQYMLMHRLHYTPWWNNRTVRCATLSPVHTGHYSREFGDYSRQCGQGFRQKKHQCSTSVRLTTNGPGDRWYGRSIGPTDMSRAVSAINHLQDDAEREKPFLSNFRSRQIAMAWQSVTCAVTRPNITGPVEH